MEVETSLTLLPDSITSADCCRLIQRNIQSVMGFSWASGLDFDDIIQFIVQMVGFGRENPNVAGVLELLPRIEQFLSLVQRPVRQENVYSLVYSSPWAPSQDIEEKHYDLSMRVQKWVGRSAMQVPFLLGSLIE